MRRIPLGLVAISAATALAFTSATPTPLMTDDAGDGNAINGQGFEGTTGQDPTVNTAPANVAMDLTGLSAATLYEAVVTETTDGTVTVNEVRGLQLRLATAGVPSAADVPTITRIRAAVEGCTTWIQYYAGTNGQQAHDTANIRILDGCGLEAAPTGLTSKTITTDALTVTHDEDTGETVFSIDFSQLPADLSPYLKDGAYLDFQPVEVRVNTGVVTAPVVDLMAPDGWAEFTVGEDVPAAS